MERELGQMVKDNKILATYVTYNMLYKDKNTDVYDIISEFAKYVIVKEHKTSYTQTEIAELVEEYFDFQIPSLVLKPSMGRISGVTLQNKQYLIDYGKIGSIDNLLKMQESAINDNRTIIIDLLAYIENLEGVVIEEKEKGEIESSFRRYILDESTNDKYAPYISAFVIEKSIVPEYVKKLNSIREGYILYSGLSLNQHVSEQGWKNKLTIYLDMEILFHLVGYNGEIFEKIANEFLTLVKAVNKKKNYISLKYFKNTKIEIENFFDTAEKIYINNQIVHPGHTAMESILNGCKESNDILIRKVKFFTLLNKLGVYEEKKNDFYDEKYQISNLESDQYSKKELEDVTLISHINKLRNNQAFSDYAECRCILLSETGSVLEYSKKFTSEKESEILKVSKQEERIVPYAVNLYTLTNTLWYRLNKSLSWSEEPSTVNAVIRAQIVLSKYIKDSVVKQYDELLEKQKKNEINREEMAILIHELRRRSKKPENMIRNSVDDAISFICEKDIDKVLENYQVRVNNHKHLEEEYRNTKTELIAQKEEMEKINKKVEMEKHARELQEEKNVLLGLENQRDRDKWLVQQQELILHRKQRNKKIVAIIGYVIYYVAIIVCIVKFTWNTMEPVTYILGIPPMLYLAISKISNIRWGITEWINSYKTNAAYREPIKQLELSEKKVDLQKEKVNEKEKKLEA